MPRWNEDTDNAVSPAQELANTVQQRTVVDTTKMPIATLMPFVSGYSWTVQFYNQVLALGAEPVPLAIELDPTIQQYSYVANLEIRVSTPLNYSYVAASASDEYNGDGVIYAGTLKPNVSDMFMADVGDGQIGVFAISSVTPVTYSLQTAYQVSYYLVSYQSQAIIDNLVLKTIETQYYVREFLQTGKDPLLTPASVARKNDLERLGAEAFNLFKSSFVSRKYEHVFLPGQEKKSYDKYMVAFLRHFINISRHRELARLNYPSFDGVGKMDVDTLWDCILDMAPISSRNVCKKQALVDTWILKGSSNFTSVYYTAIELLVYPTDDTYDVDDDNNTDVPPITYPIVEGSVGIEQNPIVDNGDPTVPNATIYPVMYDDYYVLSVAFYNEDRPNQSLLELSLTRALAGETLNSDDIVKLCDEVSQWGTLEQFYYIPILLVLIDYFLRKM